ncbi:phospholipase ABHD3-like isoform X2 [Lineus longissimus]|uniref:phospholipase ABHD3-like isoform X2 n=1 Tax=Lineus longissimus TaxID=88925 RepID=UPI00315DB5E7
MHDLWVKFHNLVNESPSIPILFGLGTVYLSYYLLYVGKKPYIAAKQGGYLQKFVLKYCPSVQKKFWPTFWCFEARAQTILRALLQKGPKFDYTESEPLSLPDGGQVKLDWYCDEKKDDPKQPTVLILPGLTGSSDDCYIRIFVKITADLGYRAVVFNNRGNGGAKLMTPRTYCAADTADLEQVVSHISKKYKDAPLMAMGISLGGMILYNYCARIGGDCPFVGAMIVSVAWNPIKSSLTLEKPLDCFLFNRMLAKSLVEKIQKIILGNYIRAQGSQCRFKAAMMNSACWDLVRSSRHLEQPVTKLFLNIPITFNCRQIFRRNMEMFEDQFDVGHILKSSTIREFDERFTSKMFGFASCEAYYQQASLHDKIHQIKIPVLSLNAADDPFSLLETIPVKEMEANDNIACVITSHGGHIGFLDGLWPRRHTYMNRLYAEFVQAVFSHGDELVQS